MTWKSLLITLWICFWSFLKYWECDPAVVLAHQQKVIRRRRGVQPQNGDLTWAKKNVKTADRLDRTHSMDQHDGHTLRRTASSVPNHAIAAKMAATTSAAKDVCKHGKNAWKVQKASHASHSLGSAPRPLDGLRCSSSSRGKATIWMPISNQERYNAIPIEHFASVLSLTIELSF